MKVLKRQISSKDGDGFVQMKTEEAEDMWHAYNLIADGDRVRTSTVRKVCTHSVCCQGVRLKFSYTLHNSQLSLLLVSNCEVSSSLDWLSPLSRPAAEPAYVRVRTGFAWKEAKGDGSQSSFVDCNL